MRRETKKWGDKTRDKKNKGTRHQTKKGEMRHETKKMGRKDTRQKK